MATNVNPYQAPSAAVADAGGETQPVKVFSVSGRIGRARYIAYGMGFYILFGALAAGLSMALGAVGAALMMVGWVALVVIGFMLTIQRCHDFNMSGWLSLLMFVPLANLIFLIIPGTDGPNRFGGPTPPNSLGVLIAAWFLPAIMVIGIVAAIALPAYQDYQKRAAGQIQKR
ncbi:MAG TPA: DUF805 domain-containing protein [Burkholderiales bacterium]|jgi:uncharacterized membrane protein YhaH (DUF805 family)